jgi:hypothetical protein
VSVAISVQLWLAAAATALAACASIEPQPSSATVLFEDTIGHLEGRVVMPDEAQPLAAYDRYYANDRVGDREVIRGVYLLHSSFGDVARDGMAPVAHRAGVFRGNVEYLPVVADGGCALISVYFDIKLYDFLMLHEEGSNQLPSPATCNGLA